MITQGKVTEIFYMTDNCSKVSDDRMKKIILDQTISQINYLLLCHNFIFW